MITDFMKRRMKYFARLAKEREERAEKRFWKRYYDFFEKHGFADQKLVWEGQVRFGFDGDYILGKDDGEPPSSREQGYEWLSN